eukprot:403352073
MPYACAQCNKYYNLTTRKPIELKCQCTICLDCHQMLSRNKLQKEITCPQCSATSIKSGKPAVNEMIMRKIEDQNSLFITCDIHQTEMASHYCIECQSPVCTYCQLEDTQNSHQIVKMSRSQFTNYTTNVMRIFDEYQVDNMKALLSQQSGNEISLDSIKLKQAIQRVTRMLGPHIDEDETTQIDFKSYLLNLQQNAKRQNNLLTIEDFNEFKQLMQDQINQQLQESQSLIKEEIKQTLNAFESNQKEINNQTQNQVDHKITETRDNQQKVLSEFRRDINENLLYYKFDISKKIEAFDESFQKFTQYELLRKQSEQQIQNILETISNLKASQDQQAQIIKLSESLLKQEIKSEFEKRLYELETRIQAFNKENELLNVKLINTDLKYNSLIQQAQEGKCNCQNEFKLLDHKFAEYNDKIESLKLLTQNEINNQANKLLEFQSNVKSNATKADIEKINQQLNSQDKQRQKFDSDYQSLKKSVQSIQQNQDQQAKDFKQTQSKQKQDIDALTEKLNTTSIKQELQEGKQVQNALDLRLTNLEQELKSAQISIQDNKNQLEYAFEEQSQQLKEEMKNFVEDQESLKLQSDTFSNELLLNINELKISCDQNHQMNVENNSKIEEEVKSSEIIQDNLLDNISSTLATIVNRQIQQEEQKVQDNGNIISLVQVPSVQECMELSDQLKKQLFKDLVDQEINKTQHSLLQQHISEYSTKQYKLLYCGSRDGFTVDKFHELCDNKGLTVCFILSEYGLVFGGYTSISWTSDYKWYSDPTAFVFSLSKRSIHKQYRNQQYAVIHQKMFMCAFGGGCDIAIGDNFDKHSSNSNLGSTYELPNGYKYQSIEAKQYLAGQKNFKILEIQVYSVQ